MTHLEFFGRREALQLKRRVSAIFVDETDTGRNGVLFLDDTINTPPWRRCVSRSLQMNATCRETPSLHMY